MKGGRESRSSSHMGPPAAKRRTTEDEASELIGYTDRLNVRAGESVRFMVSSSAADYDCKVVRLLHGDSNKEGPGFREEHCLTSADGRYAGRRQFVRAGSYVEVEEDPAFALSSFTLQTWIEPTLPGNGKRQAIMSRWCSIEERGYGLFIGEDGRIELLLGGRSGVAAVETVEPLQALTWYFVAASFDNEQTRAVVYVAPLSPWAKTEKNRFAMDTPDVSDWHSGMVVPFRIGATGSCSREAQSISDAYNGKIDSPRVFNCAVEEEIVHELARGADPLTLNPGAVLAAWDFSVNQSSTRITDRGSRGLHGRTVNLPGRAVTGWNWSGAEVDFRQAPEEYGAIHFHSDDVEDAQWEMDFEWSVPPETKSGIYAAFLEAGDLHDHIPFVVTPGRSQPRKQIVFLLPTMTYLAYANERLGDPMQPCCPPDWTSIPETLDDYLASRPEFGKSLYDMHDDLSGVFYSSAHRPIPNLRPLYRSRFLEGAARHLAGDLYLIDWLEHKDFPYDVITDHDLHSNGREILNSYDVLVTGSHPEYCTKTMLDALEGWIHHGGRMMYLGGNGFFWVTSVHPELPHVIEVRRGNSGSEPWEPRPGELHHSTTGESGGLWRFRGRLPNRLTGVGFAGQGADGKSVGYRRELRVASAAEWVFAGVAEEVIGGYGLVMGGAVGDEVDRADSYLGTPPEAVLLATSEPLGEFYCATSEDVRPATRRGRRSAGEVRADMVLLQSATGGAVFAVGSISWSASLSHNEYDNDISRVTDNVMRHFLGLAT
jgi:N,N-dimethylformamidase